ncbi:MAG: hypothetical protein LCH44_04940 [Bacteroidetes bacterium]|nr:hypothetical protein [Bacteroidota bacterium]
MTLQIIRRWFFIVGLILLLAPFLHAQIQMEVTPDTNRILIGDKVKLTFTITCEPSIEIEQLTLDSITVLTGFELSDATDWVEKKTQMSKILTKEIMLTVFNPGEYEFPKVPYTYRYQGNTKIGASDSWHLTVLPYTTPSQDIAPNKDIIEDNSIWNKYGNFILMTIGAITLLLIVFYFYSRFRKHKSTNDVPAVKLNPAEKALTSLAALKVSESWKDEDPKAFQTDLSTILRNYLQEATSVPALHLTSHEIIHSLKKLSPPESILDTTDKALNIADLVKFAKAQSREEINLSFIDKVRDLVLETEVFLHQKKVE